MGESHLTSAPQTGANSSSDLDSSSQFQTASCHSQHDVSASTSTGGGPPTTVSTTPAAPLTSPPPSSASEKVTTTSVVADPLTGASIPVLHVRKPSAAPIIAYGTGQFEAGVNPTISTHSSVEDFSTVNATTSVYIPRNSSDAPLRSTLSTMSFNSQHSVSPGSALSSPALAAMTDITPLPSPLLPEDSPGSWKSKINRRSGSAGSLRSVKEHIQAEDFAMVTSAVGSTSRSASKKKIPSYSNLGSLGIVPSVEAIDMRKRTHSRNRSLSEQIVEPLHNIRPRNTTLSSTIPKPEEVTSQNNPLHRESYLAEKRGLTHHPPPQQLPQIPIPTPPPSNRSTTESESEDQMILTASEKEEISDSAAADAIGRVLMVKDSVHSRKLKYRVVRPLGQGTFSKVVLATSEALPSTFGKLDENSESKLDKKQLVAIKIVDHGPAGGADEERVELSLKREIEIMQSVRHPSLIHLAAFDLHSGTPDGQALLVLNYCAGGDLFDLASEHRDAMTPAIVQRIFTELASAVGYLHEKWIVHRDIKLENALVNIQAKELISIKDISTYPHPIVTLTDLGLSRKLPTPPAPPTLTTRCGSEDYAAPEILLSQPYDGRATDAWALGVLLYALMEGRLPFDPPPSKPGARVQMRGRTRAAHRIARCDWIWCRFGDADGDWDEEAGKGWEGARDVVDGLLRKVTRGRWGMDKVLAFDWVKEGVKVEGGLRRIEEDNGDVNAMQT